MEPVSPRRTALVFYLDCCIHVSGEVFSSGMALGSARVLYIRGAGGGGGAWIGDPVRAGITPTVVPYSRRPLRFSHEQEERGTTWERANNGGEGKGGDSVSAGATAPAMGGGVMRGCEETRRRPPGRAWADRWVRRTPGRRRRRWGCGGPGWLPPRSASPPVVKQGGVIGRGGGR